MLYERLSTIPHGHSVGEGMERFAGVLDIEDSRHTSPQLPSMVQSRQS